ncbi:GNAT family N-acetyltransferase [Paenibacillus sp. GCM10023248]|uniref:GNAT family N-acetyltransferase n=1 Tax=Bacillales TaxID=1385 RepID=UPI0023794F8C|nr:MULTISPECIES: GNAT family N-acetyltransferase [Bacillales]MDD9271627.1 GNAT family N-acetyltransferase [Paenibacillus sp. MAHUQ-63]MDR6884013.1 putative acetyltransferase [Bacillus sp. 3255]
MHQSVKLIKPSADYKQEYISFYEDWKSTGEDIVPWVVEKEPYDFTAMVNFLYSQDTEDKIEDHSFVPHSTYWLVNEHNRIVGAVNIRHRLNAKLLNSGGHIGYGIRPSERRKGYASALLALALQVTQEMGLDKVLLVCDKGNVGSERTIVKNGGRFESEYVEEDGNVVRRFWIQLQRS